MLFREHRGGLEKSMQTVMNINNHDELVEYIRKSLAPFGRDITKDMVNVTPYVYDHRIGWDTHMVYVTDYGVFGYTNGPCN